MLADIEKYRSFIITALTGDTITMFYEVECSVKSNTVSKLGDFEMSLLSYFLRKIEIYDKTQAISWDATLLLS